MSWNDLETNNQPTEQEQSEQPEDWNHALDRCVTTVLDADSNGVFVDYLRRIAMSRSYKPGRPAEDTAWSEGYRALAVELLGRGNKNG